MLFNCFSCGKSISSKKEVCVYCRSDMSSYVAEFNQQRKTKNYSAADAQEKYPGTFFSFLVKKV